MGHVCILPPFFICLPIFLIKSKMKISSYDIVFVLLFKITNVYLQRIQNVCLVEWLAHLNDCIVTNYNGIKWRSVPLLPL